MLKKIAQRLKASHQRLRRAYAAKLSPTQDNFWARVDYYWFDHAILRTFWTNFFEIAPGIYRSNQPTERRLEDFKKMAKERAISKSTIVFNDLVDTVDAYHNFWEVPAVESWHNRFFK